MKKLALLLAIVAVGAAWYFLASRGREPVKAETAYELPDTLPVVDTTAVIRRVLMEYRGGDPVRVIARAGSWAQLALPGGGTGWVKQRDLISAADYARGEQLIRGLSASPVQADGHTGAAVNLHLKPSRSALKLGEIPSGSRVEVYGRRVAVNAALAGAQGGSPGGKSVWYLIASGPRAGWALGEFIDLDIPAALADYAQGVNMVAWLPLDYVSDGGQQVPQYLAADRMGGEDFDFNHIRVFTWWVKRHKYVTAYVESGLDGYFPIVVTHENGTPYFHLHVLDPNGARIQRVYGLFDTIVRPVGIVNGWTSDALPAPSRGRRRRGGRR